MLSSGTAISKIKLIYRHKNESQKAKKTKKKNLIVARRPFSTSDFFLLIIVTPILREQRHWAVAERTSSFEF